jgi:hypothetical protein
MGNVESCQRFRWCRFAEARSQPTGVSTAMNLATESHRVLKRRSGELGRLSPLEAVSDVRQLLPSPIEALVSRDREVQVIDVVLADGQSLGARRKGFQRPVEVGGDGVGLLENILRGSELECAGADHQPSEMSGES